MEQECSCGCGQTVTMTCDGTTITWNHPTEGGKYFATESCKRKYLDMNTHQCGYHGCEERVLDGSGSACPAHKHKSIVLTRTGLGGAPAAS